MATGGIIGRGGGGGAAAPMGRGRGATLPAWMTDPGLVAGGLQQGRAEGNGGGAAGRGEGGGSRKNRYAV